MKVHKKTMYSGSGITVLVISNEEMNYIMKIVQALEDSGVLLKGVTKTIENQTRSKSGGYLGLLLGIQASTLLGNMLSG